MHHTQRHATAEAAARAAALVAGAGAGTAGSDGTELVNAAAGFVGDQVHGAMIGAAVELAAEGLVEAGLTAAAGHF